MDVQTVIDNQEFRQKTADVLNEYIDKVPALTIADFLNKLSKQFSDIAKQQYENALKIKQENEAESEVEDNGREEDN